MKTSRKIIGLMIAAVCVAIVGLATTFLHQHLPKTSLVIQPESTNIGNVRSLDVPSDQTTIISTAEQASFTRNNKEVNVTVIQAVNESMALCLFEAIKAGYLAQELTQENITVSESQGAGFYCSGRPFILLLRKDNYIILSCSEDKKLALDAAKAQG